MHPRREASAAAVLTLRSKLAVAGVLALWLALLAGLCGRYAWPLDLFSHFRVQHALLFVVFAALAALAGRRLFALLSLAGMVLSAAPVFAYLGWPLRAAEANVAAFRLVSFNIWFRNRDSARVAAYLEQTQADAIVLQELTPDQAAALRARLPSYPHAYLEPGRYGAAIFTRWPILQAATLPLSPSAGEARAAQVVIDWHRTPVTIVGVHLHWPLGPRNFRWRNEEMIRLAAIARDTQGPLLIAGDFNAASWSAPYQDLVGAAGLSDCATHHGIAASWPAQFPPLGIPIDHCLSSHHWRSIDVNTGPYLGSDHRPLVADLAAAGN